MGEREHIRCEEIQGLLAASLYEEPDGVDGERLRRHLASCADCRKTSDDLGRLVAGVPTETVALDRDLTLVVRHRIRTAASEPRWRQRAVPAVAAACLLFLGGALLVIAFQQGYAGTPLAMEIEVALTPMERALDQAESHIENYNYVAAHRRLHLALAENAGDPLAGEAQRTLADVAFRNGWYPEARAAYDALAENYAHQYQQDVDSIHRRDILHEAAEKEYGALHRLDAARRSGDFGKLERVVSEFQGTFVATLAAEDMGRLVGADQGLERVDAMQEAANRCSDPIAVAQLKFELAHAYLEERSDAGEARKYYREVAEQDSSPKLARLAQESLSRLDSTE